jgi:hypothetical protein
MGTAGLRVSTRLHDRRDRPREWLLSPAPFTSTDLTRLAVGQDFQGYLSRSPMSCMNLIAG